MITNFNQLDVAKKYTYADYITWQFKERVELLKGLVLKMSPAPSSSHQRITGNIFFELKKYLRKKNCNVFIAPFDVRFISNNKTNDNKVTTVVQPDICVICDESKVDERGCLGSPDLIVEVLSKGNTKKEVDTKYKLYEANGVKEYWIVQPSEETIIVFDLVDGKYQFRKLYGNEGKIPVGIFKSYNINLQDIFN